MIKKLLEQDFIKHYLLDKFDKIDVISKNDIEFVLIDNSGKGEAKYSNPNQNEVNIIDYESFFKSLPHDFQQHKKNCDFIVYIGNNQCFLLNELTNTNKGKGRKRTHAIQQMLETLRLISTVANIKSFTQVYSVKRCCYFNKKIQRPSEKVDATLSFNRQNDIFPKHGSPMVDADIEKFGFELWEFSGNQTYLLQDKSADVKTIAEQLSKLSADEAKGLSIIN